MILTFSLRLESHALAQHISRANDFEGTTKFEGLASQSSSNRIRQPRRSRLSWHLLVSRRYFSWEMFSCHWHALWERRTEDSAFNSQSPRNTYELWFMHAHSTAGRTYGYASLRYEWPMLYEAPRRFITGHDYGTFSIRPAHIVRILEVWATGLSIMENFLSAYWLLERRKKLFPPPSLFTPDIGMKMQIPLATGYRPLLLVGQGRWHIILIISRGTSLFMPFTKWRIWRRLTNGQKALDHDSFHTAILAVRKYFIALKHSRSHGIEAECAPMRIYSDDSINGYLIARIRLQALLDASIASLRMSPPARVSAL